MKKDRELLELAAKAAGLTYEWDGNGRYLLVEVPWRNYVNLEQWNPLTDDGDALRLLASMREKFGPMLLAIFEDRVECGDVNYCQSIEDIVDGNIPRAIRRAIVRAAAQIQLDKEKQ